MSDPLVPDLEALFHPDPMRMMSTPQLLEVGDFVLTFADGRCSMRPLLSDPSRLRVELQSLRMVVPRAGPP